MALPSHLWLPDGVELPPGGPLGAPPAPSSASAQTILAAPPGPVIRRRAVLRGEGALPDRPVLVEWLRGPSLDGWLAEARARLGACHAGLLRPLRVGLSDPQTGFVVSEQPDGLDLLTVLRAARGQPPEGRPPPWFFASVLHEAGRGLLALQRHLGGRAGLHPASVFIDWQGDVRLLAFAALPPDLTASEAAGGVTGIGALAPELRFGPRLAGTAADVYALAHLLTELLPAAADGPIGRLRAVLERGRAQRPEDRPPLPELLDGLAAYLLAAAPLQRRAARGAQLARLCPQESAGDLGALDLLGAWEDVWGAASVVAGAAAEPTAAPAAAPGDVAAAPPAERARPRAAAGAGRIATYVGAAALGAAGLYFALQALLR